MGVGLRLPSFVFAAYREPDRQRKQRWDLGAAVQICFAECCVFEVTTSTSYDTFQARRFAIWDKLVSRLAQPSLPPPRLLDEQNERVLITM